jgi:hypothetical protein
MLAPVVVVLLAACAPHVERDRAAPAVWDRAAFLDVRGRFMPMLDDAPGAIDVAALAAFEARMATIADGARRSLDQGALAGEDRALAGLALVYDALLIERDLRLVDRGLADPHKLFAARRYAPSSSLDRDEGLRAECAARHRAAVDAVEHAAVARPDDGRIASWRAAMHAHVVEQAEGKFSAESLDRLLVAVEVSPSFNLFTALILFRDQPIDSPQSVRLFARVERYIAETPCRDARPETPEGRICLNGPRAPHNNLTARVMIGDVYLRRGEAAFAAGDFARAMPLVMTAKGVYDTAYDPERRDETRTWRNGALVGARLERVAALRPGQPPLSPAFWRSTDYERIYECSSCHVQ